MLLFRRICKSLLQKTLINNKQIKPAIFIGNEHDYNANSKYWVQDKFGYFVFIAAASSYLSYKIYDEYSLIPKVEAAELLNFDKKRDRFNFVADVVEVAAPAVVYIEIKDSRFNFFTGKPVTISNGSGFIIREDGLILTNAHVVTNKPHTTVEVRLHNGKTYQGFVEDADIQSDLATVRIRARNLPTLKLGKSSDLRAGEFVIAMGSPLALSNTVTFGVISSVDRGSDELGLHGRNMTYLQTDAAITFGNSGGPLINLDGEAIGINSMKVTAGISFAIPSDYVKKFLDEIKSGKRTIAVGKRKYMGITMLTLTPQILNELRQRRENVPKDIRGGVLVWKVIIGSPAHNGGLQPGDIVTHIDDKPVSEANDVYKVLNETSTKTIKMTIHRNGKKIDVWVTPETLD